MNKKTVLIIDDEITLQKALSEVLQQEGFKVVSALDGETGLQKCKTSAPDLILLDIILPKMDGFKIFEEIRASKKLKKIPVMVLTNLEENVDVGRMASGENVCYLVKSNYSLENIVSKVQEILK